MNTLNRREFIAGVVAAGAVSSLPALSLAGANKKDSQKISIFSKHLQWLDYDGMAQTAAELGFDGVDLTVRPKGHVLPERVEDDLPKAVAAIKKAGMQPLMMVTAINDPDDPTTEKILKTASGLGIKYYRMGYYKYRSDKSILSTLAEIRPKMKALAAMNAHYGIHGAYQNHAGNNRFGAPIWDLWQVIKDLDPQSMGCQFDIRHATLEGGTDWPMQVRLMSKYINTVVIKDFYWTKKGDSWKAINCPFSEGMVHFDEYFGMLKNLSVGGPFTVHYEYPLGGAEHGARKLTIDKSKVLAAMRRDLQFVKTKLRKSGLL